MVYPNLNSHQSNHIHGSLTGIHGSLKEANECSPVPAILRIIFLVIQSKTFVPLQPSFPTNSCLNG